MSRQQYPHTDDPVLRAIFEGQAAQDAAGKPVVVSIPFPEGYAKTLALIDRVREDIDNAKDNGYDLLAPGVMTDREIAEDLTEAVGDAYSETLEEIIAAIAAVRADRAA